MTNCNFAFRICPFRWCFFLKNIFVLLQLFPVFLEEEKNVLFSVYYIIWFTLNVERKKIHVVFIYTHSSQTIGFVKRVILSLKSTCITIIRSSYKIQHFKYIYIVTKELSYISVYKEDQNQLVDLYTQN